MTDHFSYEGEGPARPFCGLSSFQPNLWQPTMSDVYWGPHRDTELCRPAGLAPQRGVLAGAFGYISRTLRGVDGWCRSSTPATSAQGCYVKLVGSWRAASASGIWLWRPCHPHRDLVRKWGRVVHVGAEKVGASKSNLRYSSQNVTKSQYVWTTFESPVSAGGRRYFSQSKWGSIGWFACGGDCQPIRCQRP
jgi:hypothetical protein